MNSIDPFILLREVEIPEINSTARYYRHNHSRAHLLSLINQDENKCFGVAFRTPPDDSTGVAHILEHGVLNGSRKYPVKEPFVELVKGSLNTFLNATTLPDKTVFPVASTNLQDFYNLVDVYMDAVLYPLIPEHILEQEGWHYETEGMDDPIRYKGVVFNEMKGVYSSPESRLTKYSVVSLFPDTVYRHDYGGDPRSIPELTYEKFKSFHTRYYHPTNALFYFYGDDDPAERLRFLDGYLKDFAATPVDAQIPLQPFFDQERQFRYLYPADGESDLDRKSMVSVNWLLPEIDDQEELFALEVLSHLLLGTQASKLHKALIDSGLGEDLTGGGFEDYTRQPTFSTGLRGIRAADAGEVEDLILTTLKDLVKNGFDTESVEASLNTMEFHLRENNTGSFPRGLVYLFAILGDWSYGRDPIASLFYEAPLKVVRGRFESGEPLFENLVKKYLLDNKHRTSVLLEPDLHLQAEEEQAEEDELARHRTSVSEQEFVRLIGRTVELHRLQSEPDSEENLAKLPFLKLSDLDPLEKKIPLEKQELGGIPLLYHDLFTNGIVYFDLGFNLRGLDQELLLYLPIFDRALLGMGTDKEDFVQLTQRIGRKIGGLYAMPFVSAPFESESAAVWLFLRGKCTPAQFPDLLAISRDVLRGAKFDDHDRFKQLVLEMKADKESSLTMAGHSFANTRLRARYHEAYWINEQFGGIASLDFTRFLVDEIDRDWPAVAIKLEKIRGILVGSAPILANLTLDNENMSRLKAPLQDYLSEFSARTVEPAVWIRNEQPDHEGLAIPSQVNYVAKGGNVYQHGFRDLGSVLVVNNYLRTTWLWDKVRVQGGAYGAFSVWDRLTGTFTFVSYRDPNLLETLGIFDGSVEYLRKLAISRDELTKAIIGTIGDLDAYQLPDAKGFTSLVRNLINVSDDNRQRMRDEVLATTGRDFHRFGDALAAVREHGRVVAVGSNETLQAANQERGNPWLTIRKVL